MRGLIKATQAVNKMQAHQDYSRLVALANLFNLSHLIALPKGNESAKVIDRKATTAAKAMLKEIPALRGCILEIYPGWTNMEEIAELKSGGTK